MNRIGKIKAQDKLNKGAMLVDIRSPVKYRDGHIEKSENLPLKNYVNKAMGLPKKSVIILYADDIKDDDLSKCVKYSLELGLENVFVTTYDELK